MKIFSTFQRPAIRTQIFGVMCAFSFSVLQHPVLAQNGAPVGMMALVKGQVWLQNGASRQPLRPLSRLSAGADIVSGAGSSAVVVLFGNGARFKLGANARAEVGAGNVAGAQKMAPLAGPSAETIRLLGQSRVGAISARPAANFQRLSPNAPAFLPLSSPVFEWPAVANNGRYSFTLFDSEDQAIWSTFTPQNRVVYPTDFPALSPRRPYLWRLTTFGASGKPSASVGTRWGWITFLEAQDARELTATLAQLNQDAPPEEAEAALWLQVDTFRAYGVVNGALELLTGKLENNPESAAVRDEILDGLSPFSRVLSGRSVQLQTPNP